MKLGPTEKHYNLILKELKKIGKENELKVLEIGAGSKLLENFLPTNFIYHTMDNGNEFWKKNYTYNHNLDEGKFPIGNNKYDIIICNETLEHVLYPERVLKEIIRVAKDYAIFFFSMPNEYNFIMRFYYLIGKKTEVNEPFKVVEKNLHIHNPRVKDIINLFSKYFKIKEIDYVWQSRISEKYRGIQFLDGIINLLTRYNPSLFARVVAVKCYKKI